MQGEMCLSKHKILETWKIKRMTNRKVANICTKYIFEMEARLQHSIANICIVQHQIHEQFGEELTKKIRIYRRLDWCDAQQP
jgi:hypothetical protein